MVRSSIKTVTYSSGSRKSAASRQAIARAALYARKRLVGTPRAPLRTGGFYGLYNRRGREELKVIDSGAGSGNFSNTGILVLLNGVAQGTDYTNRIGRKIMLKSLLFRLTVVPNNGSAGLAVGDIGRLLLIYDCQTNAATPAVTDVLNLADFNEPMNLNNRDRFKVLADKFITIGAATYTAGALTAGSPTPKQIKIYKKMNMEQIFGATGATVGSIQTGAIFALFISQGAAASTYLYNSRIRFIDA